MSAVSRNKIGGPIPKFRDYHLWKTLILIDMEGPIGRKKLSSLLEIGEGSTRTIINILSERKYIQIERPPWALTVRETCCCCWPPPPPSPGSRARVDTRYW